MAQVKVTLTRSLIGRPEDQRATVKALGLKKTNSQVVKEVHLKSKVCFTKLDI